MTNLSPLGPQNQNRHFEIGLNSNKIDGKAKVDNGDRVDIGFCGDVTISDRMRESHDILHENMEIAHVGAEIAAAAGATGLLGALGSIGCAASGIYFGIEGVHDVKVAVKEKNLAQGIEAGGHLALAGEAAAETIHALAGSSIAAGIFGPAASALAHSHALHFFGGDSGNRSRSHGNGDRWQGSLSRN